MLKVIDVGTHMSLVKLSNGKFVCLDTIKLTPGVKKEIDSLTQNGELIESEVYSLLYRGMNF